MFSTVVKIMLLYQIGFVTLTVVALFVGIALWVGILMSSFNRDLSLYIHDTLGFGNNFKLSVVHLTFWFVYAILAMLTRMTELPFFTLYCVFAPLVIRILYTLLSSRLGLYKY